MSEAINQIKLDSFSLKLCTTHTNNSSAFE